jgi:hypothetical protein
MDFISHGKSGCNIEILNQNFNYILRKTSKNIEENKRHVLRARKQIDFYNKNKFSNIKTPQILNLFEGDNENLSYIDMKYIQGKDSLTFLKLADCELINNFISQIFSYLDNQLVTSHENVFYNTYSISDINRTSILNKVKQIDMTLEFPRKSEIINKLNKLPNDNFLEGFCHGDLTLANMIHTNNKLYIFDFLDMFVESPLFDLLSIRQDTYHLWSCFIYNDYNCRTVELLTCIDKQIKERYSKYIENEWYSYLSLLNYVRMYRMYDTTKECKELNFIYNCITPYL